MFKKDHDLSEVRYAVSVYVHLYMEYGNIYG